MNIVLGILDSIFLVDSPWDIVRQSITFGSLVTFLMYLDIQYKIIKEMEE